MQTAEYDARTESAGHHYQGKIKQAKWLDAQYLQAGDKLWSANNEWQTVTNIAIKAEKLSAYNLTVDKDHTYFIKGKEANTEGVWVHNDCDPAAIRYMVQSQKIAPDLLDKGVHFNIRVNSADIELKVLPDHKGGVMFKPVFSKYKEQDVKLAITQAQSALKSKDFQDFLIKHSDAGITLSSQSNNAKIREFRNIKKAIEGIRNENK